MAINLEQAQNILARLIQYNTTYDRENLQRYPTLPMMKEIAQLLGSNGISVDLVRSARNPQHHANLVATWGPKVDGGIAFSGHGDVVPADAAKWNPDTPPFRLTRNATHLYGRGSADMKGANSLFIAALLGWKEAAYQSTRPVQLWLTHDEEGGFDGIQEITAQIGKTIPTPRLAIVGEGTNLDIVTAHKGSVRAQFEVEGAGGHSGYPWSCINPNDVMVDMALAARQLGKKLKERATDPDFFSTISLTMIHGGDAPNKISNKGSFLLHSRVVSLEDRAFVIAEFGELARTLPVIHENALIGKRPIIKFSHTGVPPLPHESPNAAEDFLRRSCGITTPSRKVPYAAEAAYIRKKGISVALWGPGDLEEHGHKDNECLSVDQYRRGAAGLDQIMEAMTLAMN